MKTRRHDWFNVKTHEVLHGIQVFHKGQWMNYAEDNKPFFVKTKEEVETKRKELRKLKI